MDLISRQVHYVKEGKRTFDQFYLDEEYNVPDTKEDVRQIVQGTGTVKVENFSLTENYLRVSGKFYFRILYITDGEEGRLAVLEGKIPFEEMVYIDGDDRENYFVENVRDEFTTSLVHSRKIGLRVMVELEIGRETLEDEETTVDVEEMAGVYKKFRKVNFLELHTAKKDTFRIKEEITLPGTKESIGQVLLTDISSRKMDIRPGEEAIQFRGELLVFCLYLSEDGKTDWLEQSVPYEGKVECAGVDESMFYHVQNTLEDTLVDIRLDEDGEMRVLGVEGTLNLRMNIYHEEEIELLEDLYSTEQNCSYMTRDAVYEELQIQNHSKCKVAERLSLPELKEDVLQICHSTGTIQIEHREETEDGIQLEGILHLSFLYLKASDESPFGSWQGMVPFTWLLECPQIAEDACYNISYHVEQLQISLAGNQDVEVKAVLAFDTFVRKPVHMQVITEVRLSDEEESEQENRPGIVGYVVKEGEELWDIAKRYRTTEDVITERNDLENRTIKEGDKLLIFRENMSIL